MRCLLVLALLGAAGVGLGIGVGFGAVGFLGFAVSLAVSLAAVFTTILLAAVLLRAALVVFLGGSGLFGLRRLAVWGGRLFAGSGSCGVGGLCRRIIGLLRSLLTDAATGQRGDGNKHGQHDCAGTLNNVVSILLHSVISFRYFIIQDAPGLNGWRIKLLSLHG